MVLVLVFMPLLGFFCGSLLGRYLGLGASFLTVFFTLISFFISFTLFVQTLLINKVLLLTISPWIYSDTLQLDWSFCFDSLTCVLLVIVTFISSLVHLYSTEYMEFDPHLPRFMSYLSLFTFFMLILVTANTFLQLFVGWEGVGVSSYLLINFWFTRIQANKAAIKAMLVNRIGDFALLLAIFSIYMTYNSLDYEIIFTLIPISLGLSLNVGSLLVSNVDLICILLFIGAMGKSAQLGLHTWLPDAMEGPTPVSALIHAATMVTAGIFLLSRCSYIFEFSSLSLNFIVFIGSVTAFFAATTGLFQNDMKRVIAYSTCSQLGYMIFACGLSSYDVGLFHLSNHAFFKALLFLGAGSVIHAFSDEQDMRRMGGVKALLPFSYSITLIGSLALIGFPFLAGFYSKDVILEVSFAKYTVVSHFSFILGLLAAFCTAFYSTRLLYLVFLSYPNGNKKIIHNAHEGTWRMSLPLFLLCLLSIFIGYMSKDFFVGFGSSFWASSLFIHSNNYLLVDIEFLETKYKLVAFLITLAGVFCSYFLYVFNVFDYYALKTSSSIFHSFYLFLNKKWYFDRIYNQTLSQNALELSLNYNYKIIDRGIIEKLGPDGLSYFLFQMYTKIKLIQTGATDTYLSYTFEFSFLCILFLLIYIKSL